MLEWNSEQVATLTQLWTSGMSGSEVAKSMKITRNMVIGKVHRLQLPSHGRRCVDPVILEDRKKRELVRHVKNQRSRRSTIKKEQPMQVSPVAEPPKFCGSLDMPFDDLRPLSAKGQNQCRWIEGDCVPRVACANETEPGRSYCGHHHGIVYTKRVSISDDETSRRTAHGKALGLANVRKGLVRGFHVPQSVRGVSGVANG